jgi:hypothetical protein
MELQRQPDAGPSIQSMARRMDGKAEDFAEISTKYPDTTTRFLG